MVIKIVELCMVNSLGSDAEEEAKRTIIYESEKTSLIDAILDYHDNFDSDNIIESDDDFEGECLWTIDYLEFRMLRDY